MGIAVWRTRDFSGDAPNPAQQPDASATPASVAVTFQPEASARAPQIDLQTPAVDQPDWALLESTVANCQRCVLHESRRQAVFGVGNRSADWMIVGAAPGANEDQSGEPFVGKAGELRNEMLRAIGRERDEVFITNSLNCRPPGNRDPLPDEAVACRDHLQQQTALVSPRLILAVGRVAAQNLLQQDLPVGELRGTVHAYGASETPLVVTYHPADLLRNPAQKRKAWADLCLARSAAGLT